MSNTETKPESSTPRILTGIGLGVMILTGSSSLAWYFLKNQPETERRNPPRKVTIVNTVTIKPQDFEIHLPSQGRVQARAVTTISPEVTGRVVSIEPSFQEGGFFSPGQKLLTIDNSDYLNSVTKAEAQIDQLKAKLALEKIERASLTNAVSVATANLEQAQVALAREKIEANSFQNAFKVAEANLDQSRVALKLQILDRSTYSNAVTVAEANLKQAEANLQLNLAEQSAAIANLKRLNKLEGASPLAKREPQVAEAQATSEAQRATLTKAQKDLAEKPRQLEAEFQSKIVVAQEQLKEARENLKLPKERAADLQAKIKVAEAELTAARAALKKPAQLEAELLAQIKIAETEAAQAKRDASRTTIHAPEYHGRITEKRVDIGQVVNIGTVLATAIATDFAEVRLPLSNQRLAYLNIPEPLVSTNNTEALRDQPATPRPPVTLTWEHGNSSVTRNGFIDRAESRYDTTSQQLFLIAQVAEPYRIQPALRAGLFVRADITANTLPNVFVLKRHWVRPGNEVALLVERDKVKILERIPITVKWQDENVIVIEVDDNDLKAGDKVITTPIDYATNGQQLREAGDPLPGPPPGSGKGKAPKDKKKQTVE
jgi:multidrug efflux pump subunit AcrA (membrane-fusion protein)